MKIWGNYLSIYTSYELTTVDNVTRNTGILTFHITGTFPWTNMPPTACLLHSIYRPNSTAHSSNISTKCSLNFPYHCHICARNKYPLKYNTYVTCQNYSMCISEGSRLIYKQHVNSLASTTWWAVLYTEDNDANTDMMVMQPEYICWVGHWPIQPKLWPVWQSTGIHTNKQTTIFNSIGFNLTKQN